MNKPLILLIEDTEDIREALQMVLNDEGFETAWAGNGQQALNQLQAGLKPRLILLDLNMPVMSGYEFLRQRRSTGVAADVPVVVLAATLKTDTLADVTAWLRKPIGIDALIETVTAHILGDAS